MKSQNLTTTTQYFKTQNTATEGSGIYFAGMEFTPAPFVSMTLEKYSAGDYAVGGLMKVTLDGVFFGNNFSQTAAKLKSKIASLAAGHKCLQDITIGCGGVKIIESGAGWIDTYSFPQGDQSTWMNIIPYSITLNVTHNGSVPIVNRHPYIAALYGTSGLLKSVNETFSVDYNESSWQTYTPYGHTNPSIFTSGDWIYSNATATVNYSISVGGLGVCSTGGYIDAGTSAFNAVNNRQGLGLLNTSCSGAGFVPSGWSSKKYNHTRKVDFNEIEGTYTINGSYIIRPSGCSGSSYAEDVILTLDTNADSSLDDGSKNIQINGSIKTLTEVEYGTPGGGHNASIGIAKAEQVLKELIWTQSSGLAYGAAYKNSLLNFTSRKGDPLRALSYGNNDNAHGGWPNVGDDSVNDLLAHHGSDASEYRLVSKSIKRNHTDGSIDFSLSYSNKNRHKIPHALWAEVNVDWEGPSRRLAEHVVPGRGYPLMQDIMCDTPEKYTITVNAQFEPRSNVHGMIAAAQAPILSLIYQTAYALSAQNWVRTGDNESVGNNGSYKRTVTLTRHSCVNSVSNSNYPGQNMVIDSTVTVDGDGNSNSDIPDPYGYIPATRIEDGHNP